MTKASIRSTTTKYHGLLSARFIIPNVVLFVVVAIVVEVFYATVIRPRAAELHHLRDVMIAAGAAPNTVESQSIYLVIEHLEPEIEVMFGIWGLIFLGYKFHEVARERRVLHSKLLFLDEGERIIPDNADVHFAGVRTLMEAEPQLRERMLPRCVLAALHRFKASHSIQDASAAVKDVADRAGDDLDSSLSLVRYIAWAVPALGFVGTVRGIGEALSFAEQAIKGDLAPVTRNLGLAFNSTFVGLMICILLMYVIHLVQSSLETLVSQVQSYCDENVIDVMRVPLRPEAHRQPWESDSEQA